METIICDICKSPIAQVDELKAPISGDQLKSMFPGMPSTFHPSLGWEHLKCPYCSYRPFLKDDEVTTKDFRLIKIGFVTSEDRARLNQEAIDAFEDGQGYECRYCGKPYQHASSKARHEKLCQK